MIPAVKMQRARTALVPLTVHARKGLKEMGKTVKVSKFLGALLT